MEAKVIEAQPRDTGSKAARDLRANNQVPCVLYGPDTDPVSFAVPVPALNKLIYSRSANVVEIQMDGDSWPCILKDYDLHPITDRPQHADFQVLREGRKITLTVPINYEGVPQGQKDGGDTQIVVRELTISVKPENIPSMIDIDISELEIGDAIHIYDLDEDYDIKMADGQTLVTVVAPRLEAVASDEEEAEEEELEEGEELPEGEEAEEGEEEGEEAEEA
jgi:large subunit ribosomal protein L25